MLNRVAALTVATLLIGSLNVFAAGNDTDAVPPALKLLQTEHRPATLKTLYGTYGALQVMDIVSTRKAMRAGAAETNPVMGAGTTGRMIAMKAAGSAVSIYFAERLWRTNRVGAIVTMAAVNGLTAAVVARNAAHIRR